MTDTDTDTMTKPDYTGTQAPSAMYDGARTTSETDARYKEAFRMATLKGEIAPDHETVSRLQEDHRRAHVRLAGGITRVRRSYAEREAARPPVVLQPEEDADGHLVITCQGPCGETKNFKKFPTLSGGRPGRGGICRDCNKAKK